MTPTILILSGGGPPPTTPLPRADFVIAADSGLALAPDIGVAVDLVIGDLDSVDRKMLESAVASGTTVKQFPVDKDTTDLELAFLTATDRKASRIAVAGGGAGSIDHLLGVAMLIADDRWSAAHVEWHPGSSVAHVIRGARALDTKPGEGVSLIPVGDGVVASIAGTKWALDQAALPRGTTRGISNQALGTEITVNIHRGVALAVVGRES